MGISSTTVKCKNKEKEWNEWYEEKEKKSTESVLINRGSKNGPIVLNVSQ